VWRETRRRTASEPNQQFVAYLTVTCKLMDDVRSFTDETARGFRDYLLAEKIRETTIRNKLSALSTFGEFLRRERRNMRGKPLLDHNPVKTFEWPKRPRQETQFLYPDELRAFLNVERRMAESVARDIFVDCGLRASEIACANVSDFMLDAQGKPVLRVVVKGGRTELVPLSRSVAEGVMDYLRQREAQPDEPLILNTLGQRYSRQALSECMHRIAGQAGIVRIRVRSHKLRHTVNVIARHTAKLDALTRSRLLTHASPRSLDRYEHLLPGELHGAREIQREALKKYIATGCDSGGSDGQLTPREF